MKKIGLVFVVLIFATTALISWKKASNSNAAVHINDFGCLFFDGDGGFYFSDASKSVITSTGGGLMKCSATNVPNSSHKAVQYKDFYCTSQFGGTFDSHEIISASGNATLTCIFH